jgi:hypothetical protein
LRHLEVPTLRGRVEPEPEPEPELEPEPEPEPEASRPGVVDADQEDWSMPAARADVFADQEDWSMPAVRADVCFSTGALAAPDRKSRWGIGCRSRWLSDPVVDADRKGRSRSGELIVGYQLEEPTVIRPSGRCQPQGSKPIRRTDRCRPDGPMRVPARWADGVPEGQSRPRRSEGRMGGSVRRMESAMVATASKL